MDDVTTQPRIELAAEPLSLEIDPAHGGVIRRLTLHQDGSVVELLRPASAHSTDPLDSGCFPLVPFSNRIGLGRFDWGGRTIQLPPNIEGGHAIHGHGWQRAWRVEQRDASNARLAYEHEPGAWPFAYRAEQRFTVSADRLTVTLSLENRGPETMPAGLGLHPYFRRPARGGLRTTVTGVWLNQANMLPDEHVTVRLPEDLLGTWLPPGAGSLDNCFTGWLRSAAIDVPGTDRTLRLTGSEALKFLVVYAPPNSDFFSAEPVSNINNAVNLGADVETGLVALGPGAVIEAAMTLTIAA